MNTGGHKALSKDFELVSWSQGIMRHNVWYSPENNETPLEQRRVMYVVGKMAAVEYALRGLAKTSREEGYFTEIKTYFESNLKDLETIHANTALDEVEAVISIAKNVEIRLGNRFGLQVAADEISGIAKKFSDEKKGSQLAGIDSLLPTPDKYKGKPQ